MATFSCRQCRKETAYMSKSVLVCGACHQTFCQRCIQPKDHRCRTKAAAEEADTSITAADVVYSPTPEEKSRGVVADASTPQFASQAERRRYDRYMATRK